MNLNKNNGHVGLKYWDRNVKSIERKIFIERTLCKVEKKLTGFLSERRVDRCMKQLLIQPRVKLCRVHIPGLNHYNRSANCKPSTISSKVSVTAAVEVPCELKNKQRLSSDRDDPPELFAEAVGWHLSMSLQTKKSVIKFNRSSANADKTKQVPKDCPIMSTTQVEDSDDEYKILNESINSTLKKLKTAKKMSSDTSVVSSETKTPISPLQQNSIKEIIPKMLRSQTRIGSSKSPRISRVITTVPHNNTNETNEQSSGSSTPDRHNEESRERMQHNLTKNLSLKLARVRANFKVESKRKLQTKSKIRFQPCMKRRKSEMKLDLSFLSDADQQSDITASTIDDDKSENDVINMNESSAKVESEESSMFSVLSRSNVVKEEQRIPFIGSPTNEIESDSSLGQNCNSKRKLQKLYHTNSDMNDHREETMNIDSKVGNQRQVKGPRSIDSGIPDFGASPARQPWLIEADGLLTEIENNRTVDLNFQSIDHLYARQMELVSKVNSSNVDLQLREQTKNHRKSDEFTCTAPKLSDNKIVNSNTSSEVSSESIPDPLALEKEHEKNLKNSPAEVDAVLISKSINPELLNNQTEMNDDTSNSIEKDKCNKNEENYDVPKKTKSRTKVIDTRLLKITDGNSNSMFNENSSEITLISTPCMTENILLNQKETKETANMVNLHSKKHESSHKEETFQQKPNTILDKTALPLKKRLRNIVSSSSTNDLMQQTLTKDVSMDELPLASSSQTGDCRLKNLSTVITTAKQSLLGEIVSTKNNEMNDESDIYGTKGSQRLNNMNELIRETNESSTEANNTDSKKGSESLQSSASTRTCALKSTDLGSEWYCVTPAAVNKQVANGNVFKAPLNQDIYSVPVLQVLSSPSLPHQTQSSTPSQAPVQIQLQVQPSNTNHFQSQLFFNLSTTATTPPQQSNLVVADNLIPSFVQYPISILSHVQQINKPHMTSNNSTITSNPKPISCTVSKNINNPIIPGPSSSKSLPPLAPSTLAYIKSGSLLSTSLSRVSSTSATVKPTSLPSVLSSSLNQPVHPFMNPMKSPLNNPKIINQYSNSLPVLECGVNNPTQVNPTEQYITVYLDYIIMYILELRQCRNSLLDNKKTTNQQETQTSHEGLLVRCSSLIGHIMSLYLVVMSIVQKCQRQITIHDMFNYTVNYSAKIGSIVPPITVQEINNIHIDYLRKNFEQSRINTNQNSQINPHLSNKQTRNATPVNYVCGHKILLPYSNVNNSVPQNLPRMPSPQPVPPPTINYGYPGMTGEMQMSLNCTDSPKPVPPPAPSTVSREQQSRTCPPVKRSLLTTAQKRTFSMQMSAYRKINRWLALEMVKVQDLALYNHTVRQLQQQNILALQQQRRNQQQAQSHPSNPRVSRDPRIASKHQQRQQPTIDNQNQDAVPHEQHKIPRSQPRLQPVKSTPLDKHTNTNTNTGAITVRQALKQLNVIPLPVSNFNKSTRQSSLKKKHNASIVESSTSPNTALQDDESTRKENQQVGFADISSTTVTAAATENEIDNSTESIQNESEDSFGLSTAEVQSMPGILAAANSSSQVNEPWNLSPSILFRANKHQQSIMNSIGNINLNSEEQSNLIVGECHEENQMKIEPHIEEQEHTVDIKEETIKIELSFLSEMEAENESYGTKIDSCNNTATVSTALIPAESCAIPNMKTEHNLPQNVNKMNDNILSDKSQKTINNRNNQRKSYIPELIHLNDSSDDDIDCISILSSDSETIILSRDTETRDGIEYNQSSIDEELECEALSKKLGIKCPSNDQYYSYMEAVIPVITEVMTIDKNTYDNFDEETKNNLMMNDDITDITDIKQKFEDNIASPNNANFEASAIDFSGESIEGLEFRPNCTNCNNNKGTVVCECGEVSYCSDRCLKAHWPESHANVCSGPTINIDTIAEIALDDD